MASIKYKVNSEKESPISSERLATFSAGNRHYVVPTIVFSMKGRPKRLSFDDAWELKKRFGALGYGDVIENTNVEHTNFRNLTSSMDDSIESSIGSWESGGSDALNSYKEAKRITNARFEAYAPLGNRAAGAAALLQGAHVNQGTLKFHNQANSEIDRAFRNVNQMQRFLDSGTIDGVPGKSTREELQSYAVMKIINGARDIVPEKQFGAGATRFNSTKMLSEWRELIDNDAGRLLFSKQTRANTAQTYSK